MADMERVVPWARLVGAIEPLYPTSGRVGRQPVRVPEMLRMYRLQQWCGLTDEALEDAIDDSQVLRDSGWPISRASRRRRDDASHIPALPVTNQLRQALFVAISTHRAEQGLFLYIGTIVDVTTTAANVANVRQTGALLHGVESDGFGDAGSQGVQKRPPEAQRSAWHIAMRRGERQRLTDSAPRQMLERVENTGIRAKVEHPFHVIKNLLHYRKVRYRVLAKNQARLFSLFGSGNLHISTKRPWKLHGIGAS